jgi:hypothetical protein
LARTPLELVVPELDDELLLELDELELEEDELEDALPLLELDDEDDELLLELDELPLPARVTVRELTVGRPVPLPQKPNDAVPPLALMAWS